MSKYFIITVGTSTFTYIVNYVQNKELLTECSTLANLLKSFREKTNFNGHIKPVQLAGFIEKNIDQFSDLKEEIINEFYSLFNHQNDTFSRAMSAEISSLIGYKEIYDYQKVGTPFIFDFIHTDTFIGEVCGSILRLYYQKQNIETKLTKINGLHLNVDSMAENGLYRYASKLFDRTYAFFIFTFLISQLFSSNRR